MWRDIQVYKPDRPLVWVAKSTTSWGLNLFTSMKLCEVIVLTLQSAMRVYFKWQFKQSTLNYNETLQLIETSKPENKWDTFSCKNSLSCLG